MKPGSPPPKARSAHGHATGAKKTSAATRRASEASKSGSKQEQQRWRDSEQREKKRSFIRRGARRWRLLEGRGGAGRDRGLGLDRGQLEEGARSHRCHIHQCRLQGVDRRWQGRLKPRMGARLGRGRVRGRTHRRQGRHMGGRGDEQGPPALGWDGVVDLSQASGVHGLVAAGFGEVGREGRGESQGGQAEAEARRCGSFYSELLFFAWSRSWARRGGEGVRLLLCSTYCSAIRLDLVILPASSRHSSRIISIP